MELLEELNKYFGYECNSIIEFYKDLNDEYDSITALNKVIRFLIKYQEELQ